MFKVSAGNISKLDKYDRSKDFFGIRIKNQDLEI